MLGETKRTSRINWDHFVGAVAENEAPVQNGDLRLLDRHQFAVEIDSHAECPVFPTGTTAVPCPRPGRKCRPPRRSPAPPPDIRRSASIPACPAGFPPAGPRKRAPAAAA